MTLAALQAINLTKKFAKVTAVNAISFEVREGECVAFLGPNGAGKTTTVEMLEGLQTPDAGEVRLFGKNLLTHRRELLQRIGVMLQETQLYKKYSVIETFRLFASFFKATLDPEAMLTKLNLQEKRDAYLETLSGGQKQRVYLGCALINNPTLVFLDEPTTGLDPQARRALWDLLLSLKAEKKSILLTTHYMDEAERLADRVLVIDHGKIIAEGSPRALIRDICGEHVLTFSLHEDHGEADHAQLAGKVPWLQSAVRRDDMFEVITATPVNHLKDLVRLCDQLQFNLTSLELRSPTLEDVFLKLTGRSIRDD